MKYWAKHILFFSVLFLSVWISAGWAKEPKSYNKAGDYKEFLEATKEAGKKSPQKGFAATGKPAKNRQAMQDTVVLSEEDKAIFSDPDEGNLRAAEVVSGEFQQTPKDKDAYREFLRDRDSFYSEDKEAAADPRYAGCGARTVVEYYFSFSMPEESVRQAVGDALALQKNCVEVRMYVRGLVDNSMKKTIKAFYGISKVHPGDFPITINPVKFREDKITAVPTIIVNGKRLVGDMRITGILYNIDALQNGKIATTYPIKEEDLAEVFRKREPMLRKSVQEYANSGKVREKYKLTRYNGKFSHVEKPRVYYVNPTQVLGDDIRDHNGAVVWPKGTLVNPLDHTMLTGRYIFIDGNSPAQVELALKGPYKKIILVSGDSYVLGQKHHKVFYHGMDEMIELFAIDRVPLVIEQEGRLIRATELPF